MSLVATTRKLGISFFEYVRDRISEAGKIPDIATIIRRVSASKLVLTKPLVNASTKESGFIV